MNPPIPPLLRGVVLVGLAVLMVAGGGLFFLPDRLGPLWPWTLTPFNARFLGAVYLGALAALTPLAIVGRWSPARLVLPVVLTFTGVMLAVSVAYAGRFGPDGAAVAAWFAIYAGVPAAILVHLPWFRRQQRPEGAALPALLKWLLRLQIAAFGGYGLLLLALPEPSAAFWPWPLDAFHARLYSTAFLAPAVGAWMVLRATTRQELRVLGLSQFVGGLFTVAGLVIVDAASGRVDWSAAGTWLWIALPSAAAVVGVALLVARPIIRASAAGTDRRFP